MYVLTPGARVRFISYLNPDCILGATGSEWGHRTNNPVLKNLSTTNNSTTIWVIEAGVDGLFKVRWPQESDSYLRFMGGRMPMVICPDPSLPRTLKGEFSKMGMFRADPVKDGNWFALNQYDGEKVMDVSGCSTAAGTPIIAFPWNGGDNQIWRTELVA